MASAILSKRGKEKYAHDGYVYIFGRYAADKISQFWRCERKGCCKARIHVRYGGLIKQINEHSHAASASEVERDIVISKIKVRATNCNGD